MPEKGEVIDGNYTSSIENLQINDWTKIQMTKTLELLNGKTENQPSFYSIEGEKVRYNMDVVIQYLTHLCKKEDGTTKTYKEMTDNIRSENIKSGNAGGATSAWIIAVEIALEYLGYDIGNIDGILGGDTKTAVKKYQKYNNLGNDGKPGPKTIEKLTKDIGNVEKNKNKLQYVEETIKGNEKKYNFEGCINFFNGYLVFSDKFINELKTQFKNNYKEYNNNRNNPSSDVILSSIEKIFENVLKPGENWCIEYEKNNKIIKEIFSFEYRKRNIKYILADMYGRNNIKNIKLIPDFMMGYESYFLGAGNRLDYIRELGINIEECKPFIEKYLKIKSKSSVKEIDINDFFHEEINSEMLNFLFGAEITNQKKLPPIDITEGLMFYKIKSLRGEENFGKGIASMINTGIFDDEIKYYNIIAGIARVNLKYNQLSKYLELYRYLKKKKLRIDHDVLLKYPANKYLSVLKELDKYKIPYCEHLNRFQNSVTDCIKAYDFCKKNNLPLSVFNFFGGNLLYSTSTLLIDLFKDGLGRELYIFLSKYPQQLDSLGGKEIKQIELNTEKGGYNFCFRGIIEMIKSRDDITLPILSENPTEIEEQEWKLSWEKIIKEYEILLRNYISLDKDKNGNEIPRKQTFDKVFYANALDHPYEDGNGACQKYDLKSIFRGFTENFEDCSNTIISKNLVIDENNQKNMIETVRNYAMAQEHHNEKILVYVGYHGDEDGSSSNGWKREDWENLAKISPNIKILSPRCYFGAAYSNKNPDAGNYIYSIQSPVSGFSNDSDAHVSVDNGLIEGYKKGLGFHEMEIYARLHYNYSFTPLTEYMDYTDFKTGKKNRKIVGLADAGLGNGDEEIA